MRKQVQKERCTKIMLTKCKAVCHLYDKVQLAAVLGDRSYLSGLLSRGGPEGGGDVPGE